VQDCPEEGGHTTLNLRQLKDPLAIGAGNLVSSLIGALFWLFLATLLGPESYGELNFLLSLSVLVGSLAVGGLNNTIITFLAKGNNRLFRQASNLILITSAVASLVLALLGYITAAILVLGTNAFSMAIAENLGRKYYKRFALLTITNRLLQVSLALVLYYLIGVPGIILGYAIGSIIVGYRFFVIRDFSLSFDEIRTKKSLTLHSFVFASQSVSMNFDKLIIVPIAGFAMLGVYQVGFQFLMFLSIIPGSLYQYLLPQEASGIERRYVKILGLVAAIAMATAGYFMVPIIIGNFFPTYTEGVQSAQILAFGVIPLTINSLLNSRLLGTEVSKPVLVGSASYVISLVSLLLLLKEPLGLSGLALSVILSLSTQCLMTWILQRRPHTISNVADHSNGIDQLGRG
jgi:O-antigen/teichoic acid export membrane protein